MLNASVTSPIAHGLIVHSGAVRCSQLVSTTFAGEKPCNHKLVEFGTIVCDNGRCKSRHQAVDVVTAQANGNERVFARLRREFLISFWEKKSIAAMSDYHGQKIGSWPQWMHERIDLIDRKRLCPVWLWKFWVLIERQASVIPPNDSGTERRTWGYIELQEAFEAFTRDTGIRQSKVQLPYDLEALKAIHNVRAFVAERDKWSAEIPWDSSLSYWTSAGWNGIANIQNNSQSYAPYQSGQSAVAQFIVHG